MERRAAGRRVFELDGDECNRSICLSSAISADLYPDNCKTSFTNKLPSPIRYQGDGQLRIRVKAIALVSKLAGEDEYNTSLSLRLREVVEQRSDNGFVHTVTCFPYPPQEMLSANYGYQIIKNAPYLPLQHREISSLHIDIVNARGEVVHAEEGSPTLILLEITSRMMEDQFTITCTSNHPTHFPNNEVNSFASPLPREIEAKDFEVALSSVIYPTNLNEDTLAILQINDERHVYDLARFTGTDEFFEAILDDLRRRSAYGQEIHVYFAHHPQGARSDPKRVVIYRRAVDEGEDYRDIYIWVNDTFTRACGQVNKPRARTLLTPGRAIIFEGKANLYHALPNPVAMLHCNIVKPSILGGADHQFLSWLPLRRRGGDEASYQMHEPSELLFHRVIDRPFGSIGFKLTNGIGQLRNLYKQDDPDALVIVTLLFRRIKKETPAQDPTQNMLLTLKAATK